MQIRFRQDGRFLRNDIGEDDLFMQPGDALCINNIKHYVSGIIPDYNAIG